MWRPAPRRERMGGMKRLPAALSVLAFAFLLVAAACGGTAPKPAEDVGITPSSSPARSPEGEPTPTAPPAAVPTVSLPEIESLEYLTSDVEVPPLPAGLPPPPPYPPPPPP